MRIGMIAPLEMRVPPAAYGGTELVVSLLTEELVKRGHQVTLFASGDSCTTARLVPGSDRYLRGHGRHAGILSMLNVVTCLEQAADFQVIHNHTCFEGLATAGLADAPVLSTLHGGLQGDWLLLFDRYKGWYNTISHSAKSLLPPKRNFAGVIYNAVDCDTYPFNPGPRDDYLLFLSRISPAKGPHLAIEVARRLGRRLVVAGNVDSVDAQFFRETVEPAIDGDQVFYVGEADYHTKRRLFANASCLLAPLTWEEPFGLFMAEAMACGTPVVALRRGAAPEVVAHGETGFVVDDLEEMVSAVGWTREISPAACRRSVELRFSVGRMTDQYLEAYRLTIAGGTRVRSAAMDEALRSPQAAENGVVVLERPFADGALGEGSADEAAAH